MICLTFDTDWMTEDALGIFLERIRWPGRGTFFLHADLRVLHQTKHELCPHPFIEDLRSWSSGIERMSEYLPRKPRGTRPHSCVFSHLVATRLHELGYEYVSQAHNLFEPGLRPFRHPWGIWELPIYYMDNMDFWMPKNWPSLGHIPFRREVIERAINEPGLYVFDFHPIHLALNTRTFSDYSSVKERIIQDGISPFDLRFAGRGVGQFFEELCEAMRSRDISSVSCADALDQHISSLAHVV